MKRSSRASILVVLLAVTAGVVAWLLHTGRIGRRPPPSNTLTLYGNVDIRQVELGFRVSGRLKSMRFEEGETVDAGAVMAELDLRSFDDQLHAAEEHVGKMAIEFVPPAWVPRSVAKKAGPQDIGYGRRPHGLVRKGRATATGEFAGCQISAF